MWLVSRANNSVTLTLFTGKSLEMRLLCQKEQGVHHEWIAMPQMYQEKAGLRLHTKTLHEAGKLGYKACQEPKNL